jgi:hypothetical protein
MRFVRFLPVVAAGLLAGVAGCGGANYSPVSGVVTLDGKPYPNAIVSFQPIAKGGKGNPGRGSTGLTDANGKYTLSCDDGKVGAVVGKHRIRIRTKVNDWGDVIDPNVGSPDDPFPKGKKGEVEPIPIEWFGDDFKKEFEVPSGGTDKADFDIVSKTPPTKKK